MYLIISKVMMPMLATKSLRIVARWCSTNPFKLVTLWNHPSSCHKQFSTTTIHVEIPITIVDARTSLDFAS